MQFDFKQITKKQWLLLVVVLLFFFSARILPNIIHPNYVNYYSDSFFHRTIVERIKTNQPINEQITLNFTDRPNFTWGVDYVTNYPKAFHYLVAILPFQTDLSLAVIDGLLFSLLLLGIFLLTLALSKSFYKSFLAMMLFVLVQCLVNMALGNVYTANYVIGYLFLSYTQLAIHLIAVYFLLLSIVITDLFKKKVKTMIALLSLVAIVCLFLVVSFHNVVYDYFVFDDIQRMMPILLSLVLPIVVKFVPESSAKISCLVLLPLFVVYTVAMNLLGFQQVQIFVTKIVK
jgi:hypothetical protein